MMVCDPSRVPARPDAGRGWGVGRLPATGGRLTPALPPRRLQRRALRTASEKVRNRLSFSTNVAYAAPGTRVNRYISRLLEARQTELEMAELHLLTLKYKQVERERKVGARLWGSRGSGPGGAAMCTPSRSPRAGCCPSPLFL